MCIGSDAIKGSLYKMFTWDETPTWLLTPIVCIVIEEAICTQVSITNNVNAHRVESHGGHLHKSLKNVSVGE